MKRALFWLLLLVLTVQFATAEDAATEERLNQLSGKIEDLIAGQEAQRKRIAELSKEIAALRDEHAKPNTSYASQESLTRLAKSVEEVDRKRLEDYEKIRAELLKIGKTISSVPSAAPPRKPANSPETSEKRAAPDSYFEYSVKQGETLSMIVGAYREKNIKVTTDQILKANPGLKAERLRPGQKIIIPAPQS
jgi:septal ring factor EnvC (AmiA/AmiB activator)